MDNFEQPDGTRPSAQRLADLLQSSGKRVVLAESCTAGWAAAALGAIPGISDYLCGSAVVYRDQTKVEWLGVSHDDIERWSSVSEPVAAQMARNALLRTPEADYAASITGHLGPAAPAGQLGLVFVGLAYRRNGEVMLHQVQEARLAAGDRLSRRAEATDLLLNQIADCIRATSERS